MGSHCISFDYPNKMSVKLEWSEAGERRFQILKDSVRSLKNEVR